MARGGDRVHLFELLSDLQAIPNASRSPTLWSLQPDALRAAEANALYSVVQNLQYACKIIKVKILEKSKTTGTEECKEPKDLMCSVQQGDSSLVFVAVHS